MSFITDVSFPLAACLYIDINALGMSQCPL